MTDSSAPSSNNSNQSSPDESQHGKNAVEWSVFGLSCVLVLATLGYLGFLALTDEQSPPTLKVEIGEPVERDGQVWVPVTVENRGAATASNVEIEVQAAGQNAGFTLPHVPRRGQRRGWVGFEPPLARQHIKARVSGYQAP